MDEADDQIAIVGIGCNFPGGEGIENFWKIIVGGKNCTVEIPTERFNAKHWFDQDYNKPGKICTSRAALIDGFNEFDNKLFGIHNTEAGNMDPQQKLLLECTYRALEDAGIPAENISGSKTGVFIGLMNRDSDSIYNNSADDINHFSGTGTATSIAANRISYCFNLTGPSLAIDTACSSSLVALHYACQAIKQGDCEMAVCGGVSCIVEPRIFVVLTKAKMISPDGISKPFSKNADGYGRGEGCGIVLLTKLKKAKEDFSKVWGIICASAVNQDGKSVTPITRPSQIQQEHLLQSIYETIDPSHVQYIEAHGTGTPVGDPVEAASIKNIIGKNRPCELPLKIGSVKGNIGHTESAAGMAGLIKVLLMMHHEVIPPSLYNSGGSNIIGKDESILRIPTGPEKWEDSGKVVRMAGVNSFGFGGTNVHVVLKQHKPNYSQCLSRRPTELFVLSAVSSKSLKLMIEDTNKELSKIKSLPLENLVYTSACRRNHIDYKYRKAFLTSSVTHLQQQLASANSEVSAFKQNPQLVFVFCGNGVNYKGMCKILLTREPVFRKKCIEIDKMFQLYTPVSVVELLQNEFDDSSRPDISQPLLFTIQVALVALLRYWGINPDSIVGHSVGEVAAAHCSGLLSLQDAVKVMYHRSTLQSRVTGGKMLVVSNVPETEISKLMEPHSGSVCIAAYNSPTSFTLSGEANSVENIYSQLSKQNSKRNIFLHLLDVPAAYHSHLMDPILDQVKQNLQNLTKQEQETELISTVTGKAASQGDFTTGEYWAKNIREPVAFEQALRSAAKSKENPFFLEIAPRRTLQRNIVDVLGQHVVILPCVQPNKEYETILAMVATLFTGGYNPDWCHIYEAYKSAPCNIPRYQFDHVKQDTHFEKIRQGNQSAATTIHPLLQCTNEDMTEFTCTISEGRTPYVYEHKSNESVLVPGTFYVELGLAAVMASTKPKVPLSSLDISVVFSSPCIVNKQPTELKIKLEQENNKTNFEILNTHVFSRGQVHKKTGSLYEEKKIPIQQVFKQCKLVFTTDQIYGKLSTFGFQYGSIYKQLFDIHYGVDFKEGIAGIKVSEEIKEKMYDYHIHPVILDSFLHMIACLGTESLEPAVIFPSAIGSLRVVRPLQNEMFIYAKVVKKTKKYLELCGCFVDVNGLVLAEVRDAKLTFVVETLQNSSNLCFQNTWKQASGPHNINTPNQEPNILVFDDIAGTGQLLRNDIHDGLTFIMHNSWDSADMKIQLLKIANNEYNDILFMWGIHKVPEEMHNNLSHYLAKCCEVYQQVILAVEQHNPRASIRTLTFRTTEDTVDHINPGFALIGMTRACILEMPNMTFQLIDISSVDNDTMKALSNVILHYKPEEYPEVWIHKGHIYTSEIAHTNIDVKERKQQQVFLEESDHFMLFSTDPCTLSGISAEITDSRNTELTSANVEVHIDQMTIHTEDYFPLTLSSYQNGSTLFWNNLATDKHNLICLDFTGTVTAVGKDVRKLKVGDQIASCYPSVASSRLILPEIVCCSIKSVPSLRKLPCISQFILAWEILNHRLPAAKNKPKLTIVTSEVDSILCQILTKVAKERGWDTTISWHISTNANKCSAMIILPPLGTTLVEDFSHFPLLKDLVIIRDWKDAESFWTLEESRKDDVHIHVLNLLNIFQKAYIKKFAKNIYKWIKSFHADLFQSVPNSALSKNGTSKSYFSEKHLAFIELDKNSISKIPLTVTGPTIFKQDAIYVITGGLTGLGFETVKFIVQHGGGHIAILSRRNPTPEMQQEIQMVQNEKKNTRIVMVQCNVIDYSDVMKAMASLHKMFPKFPIKGVFHSAVVLHDGVLQVLNMSHFEKVLSPKVEGAVNLHRATLHQKLDYFVCYSSIASFMGNTGQVNYAAANSFLDMFCQYRRNMGLSGQSINWGALNLGLLRNQQNIQGLLQTRGILVLESQEIHEYLEKALMLNNPHQAIVKLDFTILQNNFISRIPALKKRLYQVVIEEMRTQDTAKMNSSVKNNIKPKEYIISLISELTSVSSSDITMSTPLNSLGVDSMLAMTIQSRIFRDKEVNIPIVKLLDASTTVSMLVSIMKENTSDTEENVIKTILEETWL
ncbi:mycocerosic acid synthase-like polyketide synthase [Discoglossus pictus]